MDSLGSCSSLLDLPEGYNIATKLNYMRNERICTDATFILESPEGETKEIHAHKLILAMRSSEFADKFYNGENQEEFCTIRLKRANASAFEDMIGYCYGIIPVLGTTQKACEIFKLAKEYKLVHLMELCRTRLRDSSITPQNVFSMLDIAKDMQDVGLRNKCNTILEENTRDVLGAYDIRDFSPEMVHKILDLPRLSLHSEYELADWLIRWADAKVQEGDTFCENAREYLEKFLQDINILALTYEELALLCKEHADFFCPSEIASIFMNIAYPGSRKMPDWFDDLVKVRQYTGSKCLGK